jgi:hypothetical protein
VKVRVKVLVVGRLAVHDFAGHGEVAFSEPSAVSLQRSAGISSGLPHYAPLFAGG